MHRRKSWSDSGVSEVIGTILILAMTVVLFASIILWVSSIPSPEASTRLDMDGNLIPIYDAGVWSGANITIQHRGGESLASHRTEILLVVERGGSVDSETLKTHGTVLGLPYGIDGPDLDWDAGERWSYTNYSILSDDRVSVLVIDFVKSQIVWSEPLRPPLGVHPPLFLEKWLDGDVATAFTRDIPETGLPFGLYVRLTDQDGDLDVSNVTFTLTVGPKGTYRLYDDGTNGDFVANDGIFSRFDSSLKPAKSWDGGIILLKAQDLAGHVTDSRMVFEVVEGPGGQGGGGGGSSPLDLNFQNEFQAWAIYNDTEWDALGWAANETRRFEKGEVVVVVVASQYLKNLALQNDFMLYNPDDVPQRPIVYSDPPYTQNPAPSTRPSRTASFEFFEYISGYHVYTYRFSTDSAAYAFNGVQLAYGQYHLEITLRASNVPPPRNQFNTVDAITVTDANGNAPAYPLLEFFADSAHTLPTDEFRFTDVLYVRVRVQDTDGGVTAGDVVITDFIGGVQVWARPGTAPVSTVTTNGTLYYKFTVDLSTPNPDPWIIGRNSYGFRLKWIQDTNEDYALSKQVVIQGPRWKLDIATSMEEWGHPVYSQKWYAFLNENDDLWSLYMIEKYDTSPSQSTPPWGGGNFRQMVLADTDEDGDLDAITGLQNSKVFLYRNLLGNGHLWERQQVVDYGSNQVLAVAAGRLDQDTDADIVVGLDNGTLYRYMNQGGVWAGLMIVDVAGAITALKVADYDMDGDKDIFVGRSTDNQVTIYLNNGAGVFGSPVSVAVGATVYDLAVADIDGDQDNDLIIARGANVRVYFYTGSGYGGSPETLTTSGNALAVDVGYIDGDPNLDVVAGTSTGNLYWWRNGPWGRTLITTLAGSDQVLSLRCGDVDGDFLDDVVIGSNLGDVRWFRHTSSGLWNDNLIQKVGAKAYDVDIGDVDRGVIIDRSK